VLYNMAVNPVTGTVYVSNTEANNLERFSGPGIFLLSFPTNLKPIVGQQITVRADNLDATEPRLALLERRADAGDCDLVAKSQSVTGRRHGHLYVGRGQFRPDARARPQVDTDALCRSTRHPGSTVTFTCVPPGSGYRIGIDRDLDGVLDGDQD
jgi:hypothetical protein